MRLADLHVSRLFQPRAGGVDKDTVSEYAAAMKGGAKFPAMMAYKITNRKFPGPVLVAGFHRHAAYIKAEIAEAEVDLREGTFEESWWGGYLSNVNNGLRYTNADKRKAVEAAILHFGCLSASSLADRLGVSDDLVRKVRKDLVAAKKIEQPKTVITRDGQERPSTIKYPSGVTPTVGVTPDACQNNGTHPAVVLPPQPEPDDCEEFCGEVNQLCALLDRAKATVKELADVTFGRHIHAESVVAQIEAARKALHQSRPTEKCNCVTDKPKPQCKACFGTGRCPASRVLKGVR